MSTKAVAKVDEKSNALSVSFDAGVPDYLKDKVGNTGIDDSLGKNDFKTPRIVLLQGLSPELQSFPGVALANNYWHTGMNISLGEGFKFVPLKISKRIILFRPRTDQGGGVLAMSLDAKTWQMGGNAKHSVKIKERKEPVIWDTGKDVISSRLCDWGTYNPDDDRSQPAATVAYEYLCYLPERPDLSPCVLNTSKTALTYGKALNTSLLTIVNAGRPIYATVVEAFVQPESGDGNNWTVPNFKMLGYATKEIYQISKELADKYADYKTEYRQDEAEAVIKDEIAY